MSFVGLERGETRTPQAAPATATMSLSEPVRVVQPTPRPMAGSTWERNVARDIPYYNMSALPILVYSDAEFTQKVGTLAPGEGGYIETCSDAEAVCKISYASASTGWIKMDRMGGLAN